MSTVTATVTVNVAYTCTDSSNALVTRSVSGNYPISGNSLKIKFGSGSGVGQLDAIAVKQISVPAAGTATMDVTSLVDPAGNAVNFARVVGFIFYNNDPTTKVTVGGGTNPLGELVGTGTDTLDINPQFPLMFGKNDATGYASSGTAKILTFTNGASNIILVDVILLGRVE